jgi:pimeloyl-ACP methyl ester carboxylesterase
VTDDDGDYFYDSPDGLRLYCRVHAALRAGGLPVLCLPGLTRNGRDFAKLAAHLCARHEVLRLDLRGRGRSAWDEDPSHYQLPTYVADVDALLDSRGVERIVVVGTSLGALMGLVLAANRPDRIAALVLNDAGPELDPAGLRRIASYAGKLPPVRSWAEAAAQTQGVYESALPDLSAADWLEYAHLGYREDEAGVPIPDMDPKISTAFANSATAPGDLWPVYAEIPRALPILVIRGATSDILSAATLARMVREKPNVEALTVARRGHTPLLTEPECLTAIDDFLARHARTRGGGES